MELPGREGEDEQEEHQHERLHGVARHLPVTSNSKKAPKQPEPHQPKHAGAERTFSLENSIMRTICPWREQ